MLNLVMIHGLLGSLDYLPVPKMAKDMNIIFPQLLGYGKPDVNPLDYGITLHGQAESIIESLRRDGVRQCWLLGHSVGGAIAILAAKLAPEIVKAVISVEGNFTLNDAFWCRRIASINLQDWEVEYESIRSDPTQWLASIGIEISPARLKCAVRILNYQSPKTIHQVAKAVVKETDDPQFLLDLEQLLNRGLNIHLIAGEKSAEGWDVPKVVQAKAKSSTTLPNVGHMMMLEEPGVFWDSVYAILSMQS
jgi:pimeloyl-ACP methyl ester carboxylesterase